MSWYLVPSLAALRAEANRLYPSRDKSSDGSIGDPAHSSRTSDHNPDDKGAVHAYDLDEDLDGNGTDAGAELLFLAEAIRSRRDPRVKYVIYEGRMFASYATSSRPAWTWGPYSGTNAHKKHMHVSVLSTWTGENDTSPWFPQAPTRPVIEENDDMSTYLLHRPNGEIWLITPSGATHLSDMASVNAYKAQGFKYVAVPNVRDADQIVMDANRPERMEMLLTALGQIEAREEQAANA